MLTFWYMLTFSPMLTSKILADGIQTPDMQMLFQFQVNRMKTEDFRNTTLVVDFGPILTFCSLLTPKIIRWLNSLSENINCLQISSQSDEN